MSEPILIPSDDAIERGLASRAPRRPDAALLDAVMTGVHATRQVPRLGAMLRDPIGDRRRPIVLSALAAALIIAGTLVVSTGSFSPVPPSVPVATPPAAVVYPSSPPESAASASPVTCATQTTSVLTGDAMPPANAAPMTIPAGVLAVGVYMTTKPTDTPGGQNDVWAITSGNAKRIASIVGADYNQAFVDDVSADGRTALIEIGVVHGALVGPECSDLYALQTDGSGATRLTFNGPDAHADGGTFSYDGRYVAFRSDPAGAASPVIGLVDRQGDAAESDVVCDASSPDLQLAWSRADDRLAAVCGANVMVVDIGASPAALVGAVDRNAIPTGGSSPVGVGWRDPSRILVVTLTPVGTHSNGPFNVTTLTLGGGATAHEGTWSPLITSHPWLGDGGGMSTGPISIAPDGSALTLFGDTAEDDPQGNTSGLYAMDATSGVLQPVAGPGGDVAWSSDGRSLLFNDYVGEKWVLTVYDLASKTGHAYGSMPTEFVGGIWRTP